MTDKKRMFAFPSGEAVVRFLPDSDRDREYFRMQMLVPDVHLEHYLHPAYVVDAPKDGSVPKLVHITNEEELVKAFAPYPFSSLYSYGQMQAMNALRQNLNVLEFKTKRVAIPKRKKKSWLRYTSNKKWSRNFVPKYVRVAGAVKVLSVGGDFIKKLRNIVKDSKLVHGRMAGC